MVAILGIVGERRPNVRGQENTTAPDAVEHGHPASSVSRRRLLVLRVLLLVLLVATTRTY